MHDIQENLYAKSSAHYISENKYLNVLHLKPNINQLRTVNTTWHLCYTCD